MTGTADICAWHTSQQGIEFKNYDPDMAPSHSRNCKREINNSVTDALDHNTPVGLVI